MEKTIEKDYTEKVDYDSFLEAGDTQEDEMTGEVILKRVESAEDPPTMVKANLKSDDLYRIETFKDKDLYITKDTSTEQWDVIEEWTGEREISEISGKRVPVELIDDEYYKVADFRISMESKSVRRIFETIYINYDVADGLSPTKAKELYDNGYIKYRQGDWVIDNSLIRLYNMRENVNQDRQTIDDYVWYAVIGSILFDPLIFIMFTIILSYLVFLLMGSIFDKMSIDKKEKYLSYIYGRQEYDSDEKNYM